MKLKKKKKEKTNKPIKFSYFLNQIKFYNYRTTFGFFIFLKKNTRFGLLTEVVLLKTTLKSNYNIHYGFNGNFKCTKLLN